MKMVMVWKRVCESDTVEIFVDMSEYLEESDCIFEEMKSHIWTHLTNRVSILRVAFQS